MRFDSSRLDLWKKTSMCRFRRRLRHSKGCRQQSHQDTKSMRLHHHSADDLDLKLNSVGESFKRLSSINKITPQRTKSNQWSCWDFAQVIYRIGEEGQLGPRRAREGLLGQTDFLQPHCALCRAQESVPAQSSVI